MTRGPWIWAGLTVINCGATVTGLRSGTCGRVGAVLQRDGLPKRARLNLAAVLGRAGRGWRSATGRRRLHRCGGGSSSGGGRRRHGRRSRRHGRNRRGRRHHLRGGLHRRFGDGRGLYRGRADRRFGDRCGSFGSLVDGHCLGRGFGGGGRRFELGSGRMAGVVVLLLGARRTLGLHARRAALVTFAGLQRRNAAALALGEPFAHRLGHPSGITLM